MIDVTCANCGNTFRRKACMVRGKNAYCSWACRYGNRPSKIEVACDTCGKTFLRFRSLVRKRQYCSKSCQIAARPVNVQLTCRICGKEFMRWACLIIAKREGVFCSRACASEGHKRLNEVPCTTCGEVIVRRNSELGKTQQPFCSKKCQGIWTAGHDSKRVTVPCAQCSKPTIQKRYKLSECDHFFCSRTCMGKWQSANWLGENHHSWKGGSVHYYGPNWKQQAHAARKRDGYRCRHCGVSQKKLRRSLDVHHIQPIRTFGYIPGKNENYKQANDLVNLISFCTSCHKLAECGKITIQPYLL